VWGGRRRPVGCELSARMGEYNHPVRLAVFLAVRLLRRRGSALLRTSAVAALAAVALGVAALVVVLALMSGYSHALREGILGGGGHLVALYPGGLAASETAAARARLALLPGVIGADEIVYLPGMVFPRGGEVAQVITVKAAGLLPPFAALPAWDGAGPLPVALGAGLARNLSAREGDALSLQIVTGGALPKSFPVRVARVYRTGFSEVDERWALTTLEGLRHRAGVVAANGIEVWLVDPDRAEALREKVETACPGALVATWQQNNRNLFAALRWQTLSLAVVLSLVLGVGAFEVASALVVMITEKRREIGVLLALGGEPWLLRLTLVLAGGALGLAGVLGGVVLGVAIAALLTVFGIPHFPPDIAAIYMVDRIPLRVLPGHLAAVTALGVFEVVVASLLPAHRAAVLCFVLQQQDSILRPLVKRAVANEVEDMVFAAAQSPGQVGQGGALCALQHHGAALHELGQRFLQIGPLPFHV